MEIEGRPMHAWFIDFRDYSHAWATLNDANFEKSVWNIQQDCFALADNLRKISSQSLIPYGDKVFPFFGQSPNNFVMFSTLKVQLQLLQISHHDLTFNTEGLIYLRQFHSKGKLVLSVAKMPAIPLLRWLNTKPGAKCFFHSPQSTHKHKIHTMCTNNRYHKTKSLQISTGIYQYLQ